MGIILMSILSFPNWAEFTPAKAAADLPRQLAAAEARVSEIEKNKINSYNGLVPAINDATRELNLTWGMLSHMTSVMNSDEWRKVEEELQPKMVEFGLRMGQSKPIYEAAKRLLAASGSAQDSKRTTTSEAARNETRKRILEKMVQGAELAGVALEGEKKARYNEISQELAKLGMDFANAVIDATKAFKFEKDGKTYTIDDGNYPDTMKHCADAQVREALYRARSTRAPENEARIARILALRQEKAEILGFRNYAELSLSTKCAPSVEAVLKMIDDLDQATASIAPKEDAELLDLARTRLASSVGGSQDNSTFNLQPWDFAFYSEKLREKKYSYSEEELKQYFELEEVLAGLFKMMKFLYEIDIVELKGEAKPSVWHKDVRFFEVREQGAAIAHFYLDPYVRPGLKQGGAWMNEFRNRHDDELPLALVVLNLKEPENGKTLMPMREVETLFHEFGHATQCMLTRVDEEDAAGISLVEWDAVEVASQFNEFWCLDDRTGIKVPEELKAKVKAAKNFRAASACRRQLAFAKTDLELHMTDVCRGGEGAPTPIKENNFRHFGVPMVEGDKFLCAFTHIFAGGYAAGYYGYKWAEVMCADCYGAFEEAGLADDTAVKRVGKKYRDTILALGGSKSALEVFRMFRGRDPEIEAILRQQGLKESKK